MSRLDAKWEQDVEKYVSAMTDEEVAAFLKETGFDFYQNVTTTVLGLKGLSPEEDLLSGSVRTSLCWETELVPRQEVELNSVTMPVSEFEKMRLDLNRDKSAGYKLAA